MVLCPVCNKKVSHAFINRHIDSGCESDIVTSPPSGDTELHSSQTKPSTPVSSFFKPPTKREPAPAVQPRSNGANGVTPVQPAFPIGQKRPLEPEATPVKTSEANTAAPPTKRHKSSTAFHDAAPLAERMRPQTLDEVCGQDLVGPTGVLRGLIESDRVPSMILWGGAGSGKTTIARVISKMVGSRFVEINSTSTGVAECKKIFAEARSELALTGRKTIVFCDEIHRFNKTQQDVFLGPVESGQITLIGATTE